MKHTKRLSFPLLCLFLVWGLTLTAALAADDHDHSDWTAITSLPTTAGNYYLTGNVDLTATWEVPEGETHLCLNGKAITMTEDANTIQVPEGATLHLYDCQGDKGKITHEAGKTGSGLRVAGAFQLHGGSITGNTANLNGGGVYVDGGDFTMDGGIITGNTADTSDSNDGYGGGGVYVGSGAFQMKGGSITGNKANVGDGDGGGVYVEENGAFTMSGGSIADNTAARDGGGVFIWLSEAVTMSGGSIADNTAGGYGGGVYVYGDFNMTGGSITGNTATISGGGVSMDLGAVFAMSGGSITGNTAGLCGGGVEVSPYIDDQITFTLSGKPTITGNKGGETANNVDLPEGQIITIGAGGLTQGTAIGVTTATAPTEGTPVNITGANSADYSKYFTADNADYTVQNSGEGDVQVVQLVVKPAVPTHTHSWASAWTSDATHHWHECTASGCTVTANADKDNYAEHTWDSGVVTKAPTTAAQGVRTYTCILCGKERTEPIDKLEPAPSPSHRPSQTNQAEQEPVKTVCPKNGTCLLAKFADTKVSEWYHDGVHFCLEKGLMVGTSDTAFAPGMKTSRAMIATILWRLNGSPVPKARIADFPDVVDGSWCADAVRWCAEQKIVLGHDNGNFGPSDPITREQLATMLYRYEQAVNGGGFTGSWMFLLDFADADQVSPWADEAMHYMTMHGVITGKDGKRLDPQGPATRAEVATMLQRYMESAEK